MSTAEPGPTVESAVATVSALRSAKDFLITNGLAQQYESPMWTPLTGGVSSELWHVGLERGDICVKGALATLKVAGNWQAPTTRNTVEWQWLVYAADVVPGNVPIPLAHDSDRGLFAMSYLDPQSHPVWKERLLAGDVRADDAAAVGTLIGRLHAHSAGRADLAEQFATDSNFEILRIAPYLRSITNAHPDLASAIDAVIERTTTTHKALVHGDVSPKNILVGPTGPVLLDAECAWFGDPAFDLAFAVNHLGLKMLAVPARRKELAGAASALIAAYFREVDWEPVDDLTARAGALLPALQLARVDGLSPVEYLDTKQQSLVRSTARELLATRTNDLVQVLDALVDSFS